jgi:hypothetical protein
MYEKYKYKIVRSFADRDRTAVVIKKGLTLEQAQAHCRDPKTRKEGEWFDGYESY